MSSFIHAWASSHDGQSPAVQQRPIHPGGPRSALSSLVHLIRDPVAAFGCLLDAPPSAFSLDPTDVGIPNELETVKYVLRFKLSSACTFADWRAAAEHLDEIEGNNIWKAENASPEYNYQLIQARFDQLEQARTSGDGSRMLFLIRTSLTRHLGGMGSRLLYSHSRTGTKNLIEQYISSALATLNALLDNTRRRHGPGVDSRDMLQQVLKARQSFGRSALLLSGGGTFGMNHIGVVKCLWENRLLPRIISGASAGSIVCAVLCTRTDDEIPTMLKEFCHGDLQVFTRKGIDDSTLQQVGRFLKTGALFDIANLTRIMKELLGDLTFQEAYNRTRRILNICVSSASVFEVPRLLNYITAPNVLIWSAVAASCSVPLIYSPAGLLAKDPKTSKAVPWDPTPQRWIDGSVDNDLPMTRLAEMFNVNHFIVSQVNPHVVPFLAKEDGKFASETPQNDSAIEAGPGWLNLLANLAKDEAMHRMHVLSELGVLPTLLTKTRSVLSQRYSGDITIFPEVSYSQIHNVLKNPTTEFMLQASLHGERATWSKLSRIQNHCAIELALDDAVQKLRTRIAFSPSQTDLRMNAIAKPTSRDNTGSGNRKHLRFSASGITKTTRSSSSSESDSQLPLLPPIPRIASPLPAISQKPVLFDRHLEHTFDAGKSRVPQEPSDMLTIEDGGQTPNIQDIGRHRLSAPMETQIPNHLASSSSSLAQARQYASQPSTPAVSNSLSLFANLEDIPSDIASISLVSEGPPSSNSLSIRVPTLIASEHAVVDASFAPPPRRRRRSMTTGLPWLKPPSESR